MTRRYDSKTASFSSEGRLLQVEYAFENVSKSIPTMGVLTKECKKMRCQWIGVILSAKKQVLSKLLAPEKFSEKMYLIDDHIICSVCGMASDALILVESARKHAQNYFYTFKESIPVEQLVELLSNAIHVPTQYGSFRPYGASILFAGYDKYSKFQLFCADPSGNYASWKAHVLGT